MARPIQALLKQAICGEIDPCDPGLRQLFQQLFYDAIFYLLIGHDQPGLVVFGFDGTDLVCYLIVIYEKECTSTI